MFSLAYLLPVPNAGTFSVFLLQATGPRAVSDTLCRLAVRVRQHLSPASSLDVNSGDEAVNSADEVET